MNRTLLEAVRTVNRIEDVIGSHVRLRKSGAQFVGRCPFHEDRTPSFSVHPAKQLFYCHGCQAGGDVFEFIRLRFRCSFPDALGHLAERAGINARRFRPSPEFRELVAKQQAQAAQRNAFERFLNERIEAVSQKLRTLGRAAVHAEDCLRAGESDPEVHNLAWAALERYLAFEARVEREGLCDVNMIREEWEQRKNAATAA